MIQVRRIHWRPSLNFCSANKLHVYFMENSFYYTQYMQERDNAMSQGECFLLKYKYHCYSRRTGNLDEQIFP